MGAVSAVSGTGDGDSVVTESAKIADVLSRFSQIERDNLEAQLGLYRRGEAPQWVEKKLRALNLIAPIEPETDYSPLPSLCDSIAAASNLLNAHFESKIALDLSRQQIAFWRRGERLPSGAPPFPSLVSGRYPVRAYAEWIAKYILPTHSIEANREAESASGGKNLFEQASIAEAKRKINEAQLVEIDLNVAKGAMQPVSEYIRNIRFAGTIINQAFTAAIEKDIPAKLTETLNGFSLGQEQTMKLQQRLAEACQAAADDVRNQTQAALLQAVEKVT